MVIICSEAGSQAVRPHYKLFETKKMNTKLKHISIIAMILITSCSISKKLDINDTDKAYISLSKGKCQKYCPVYDLWIFKDGKVLYNGIDNVEKIGLHETTVSTKVLKQIDALTKAADINDLGRPKGRDLPLTIIRFNDKTVAFQESRAKGNLLILNDLIEKIKDTI